MLRFAAAALAASLIPLAAQAQNTQDAPPQPKTLACTGPFARDTTHAKLVAAFGAQNVTLERVDGPEGKKRTATVLFGDDPTKRVEIYWHDMRKRARPATILISTPSQWVGPYGITLGLTATQVEKINGKAFNINGFGWDGGGYAGTFDGKLASVPGGCHLAVRFEATIANPLPTARYAAIIGDKKILSSNALMRRSKPMLSEWSVGYGE
jgi:hypothetical protein